MSTRGEFLAGVRRELNDFDLSAPVWPGELLAGFLEEGLEQLSLELPPRREAELAGVAGVAVYSLAVLAVGPGGVSRVEYGGEVLPVRAESWPGGQGWEAFSGPGGWTLRFNRPLAVNGPIGLRYFGRYVCPAADEGELGLEPGELAVLRWAVCERACGWLEGQRARRGAGRAVQEGQSGRAYYRELYELSLRLRRRAEGLRSMAVVAF